MKEKNETKKVDKIKNNRKINDKKKKKSNKKEKEKKNTYIIKYRKNYYLDYLYNKKENSDKISVINYLNKILYILFNYMSFIYTNLFPANFILHINSNNKTRQCRRPQKKQKIQK